MAVRTAFLIRVLVPRLSGTSEFVFIFATQDCLDTFQTRFTAFKAVRSYPCAGVHLSFAY